jgi:hypothetical protein
MVLSRLKEWTSPLNIYSNGKCSATGKLFFKLILLQHYQINDTER